MAGFHSHSLSADSGTGHELGNCASNPEILYEVKAVYWLREIHLFWNVMELGWPQNNLIYRGPCCPIQPPLGGAGNELDFFSQLIYGRFKRALFL